MSSSNSSSVAVVDSRTDDRSDVAVGLARVGGLGLVVAFLDARGSVVEEDDVVVVVFRVARRGAVDRISGSSSALICTAAAGCSSGEARATVRRVGRFANVAPRVARFFPVDVF